MKKAQKYKVTVVEDGRVFIGAYATQKQALDIAMANMWNENVIEVTVSIYESEKM
jgi:hypothetical protein